MSRCIQCKEPVAGTAVSAPDVGLCVLCEIVKLRSALTEIGKMAKDHPAFYRAAFDDRDIDALVNEGGDTCDWTMIAILADDALTL